MDDNLYPYVVELTTKAKDRRPEKKRTGKTEHSAKECAHVRFGTWHRQKYSPSSPRASVSCVSEKSLPVSEVVLKILGTKII